MPEMTRQTGQTQIRPRSDCFLRSSQIRVLSVCYTDKLFVNSNPDNQYFVGKTKENCVRNLRTFTVLQSPRYEGIQIRSPNKCVMDFFFLFINQNIFCGYSKEPSPMDSSFEHPKTMFKLMGKKITTMLR